ncbi:MAG TPA: ParB/RepB/Spo0J family partition protein [Firmicutes bacterium]|nr:ParB/RepB/Spo0J family partition protein [Bacillota bacterium]
MVKRGLGKGLRALIPEEGEVSREQVSEVPINSIKSNPYQPRRQFDEERLQELVESIKNYGIVQPLVVRPVEGGYQLVVGERRWRAAIRAGLTVVPVVVRDVSDLEMVELALIENLQREDLTPIEQAEAYQRLINEFGLTQEELAEVLGRSRPSIANTMRLLNLPPEVQENVSRGTLTMGHARALLALATSELQVEIARLVISRDLSVRQTEELVRKALAGKTKQAKSRHLQDPALLEIEDRLKHALGTQVRILPGQKRGKIEIEYYSRDDLERLISVLLPT